MLGDGHRFEIFVLPAMGEMEVARKEKFTC